MPWGVKVSVSACQSEGPWYDFTLGWNVFVWPAQGSTQAQKMGTWCFPSQKKKKSQQGQVLTSHCQILWWSTNVEAPTLHIPYSMQMPWDTDNHWLWSIQSLHNLRWGYLLVCYWICSDNPLQTKVKSTTVTMVVMCVNIWELFPFKYLHPFLILSWFTWNDTQGVCIQTHSVPVLIVGIQ